MTVEGEEISLRPLRPGGNAANPFASFGKGLGFGKGKKVGHISGRRREGSLARHSVLTTAAELCAVSGCGPGCGGQAAQEEQRAGPVSQGLPAQVYGGEASSALVKWGRSNCSAGRKC